MRYHGDKDPGFGAGFSVFVIPNQPTVAHEPAEGSLDHPAVGQHFEAAGVVGAFDDLDHQLGAEFLDPLGKGIAGVATIHPQEAQPSEPAQHLAQNCLGPVPFRSTGRSHRHSEHQPQSIHQQMPLAAFDPLGGVIADAPPMTIGFHALAIQNRRRGLGSFVVGFPDEGAQRVVEGRPQMVQGPLPENMENGFPRGKVGAASSLCTCPDAMEGPRRRFGADPRRDHGNGGRVHGGAFNAVFMLAPTAMKQRPSLAR